MNHQQRRRITARSFLILISNTSTPKVKNASKTTAELNGIIEASRMAIAKGLCIQGVSVVK